MEESKNYEELRDKIINRGIRIESHKNFIGNVKGYIGKIGNVRNAIAHNRKISKKDEENYQKAKIELIKEINSFWDGINEERYI